MKRKGSGGSRKGAGRHRNKHKKQYLIIACSDKEKALILKALPDTRIRALYLLNKL